MAGVPGAPILPHNLNLRLTLEQSGFELHRLIKLPGSTEKKLHIQVDLSDLNPHCSRINCTLIYHYIFYVFKMFYSNK